MRIYSTIQNGEDTCYFLFFIFFLFIFFYSFFLAIGSHLEPLRDHRPAKESEHVLMASKCSTAEGNPQPVKVNTLSKKSNPCGYRVQHSILF